MTEEQQTQPTITSMDAPTTDKPQKRKKSEKSVLIGSKQQVWEGKADITGGKLKKEDLMECPKTKKIISIKKHLSGLALMERAKKAKENPEDPLHTKFVSFFDHQYKKKERSEEAETNPIQKDLEVKVKKPRQKRQKKQKEIPVVEVAV